MLVSLSLLALAACGPVNRSLDTQKAPVISVTELGYDLRFTEDRLDPAQARAFGAYLAAVGVGYGDKASVSGATRAQRARVAGFFAEAGVPVEDGGAAAEAGVVHVAIRHASAAVPGCPDWRRLSNPESAGSTMSNYGCATRSNLAAMVADPNDLIEGKPFKGTDAFVIAKGIKAYRDLPARDATTTHSLDESTTKSK